MMWELIAANRRKSMGLFFGMALILLVLGYFIGYTVQPDGGGYLGLALAGFIWVVLAIAAVAGGGNILLHLSGAREVTEDIHPQLFNVVEEMKIASGNEKMPKIYIIDSKAPNAFATGMKPENAAIAVTAGLLTRLNRDELQGVVAHEMAHVVNRDIQFMTMAGIMLGSIVIMSDVFLRGMWLGAATGSTRRYRKDSGGGGHPIMIVVAIILAILGPVMARFLYLAISRKREYLADACAVRFTRYPEGLASALEKISATQVPLDGVSKVTAPMYIVAPLKASDDSRKLKRWDSTHPPIAERIQILRTIGGGAGLLNYQRALSKVKGKPTMIIPSSGLKQDTEVEIRDAHPDVVKAQNAKQQARDVMDLMRAVNEYAFLMCACGLKMKIPPDFDESHVACPRCNRDNELPQAQMRELVEAATVVGATVGAIAGGGRDEIQSAVLSKSAANPDAPDAALEYRRRTDGWETFVCACGHHLQLSPAFSSNQVKCRKCQRVTRIL